MPEFPEWMMTDDYRDNASNIVSRLGAQSSRGRHFLQISGARRPSADVMPMQHRSQIPGNHLILKARIPKALQKLPSVSETVAQKSSSAAATSS